MKYLPGWKPNQKIKALNIVDQASCFQQMIPFFQRETSQLLRELYARVWVNWAGPPKELILDPAATNLGDDLQTPLEFEGTHVRQIAAEAHWQLGRTENHGGWFARILSKIITEHSPRNQQEWEECVRHAHVKNQMIHSYGFTPHQHVFGRNPHLPGDLLSEPLRVIPATAGLTEQSVARAQEIRQTARKAVIEMQDDKSLRRAIAARPRVVYSFRPGDLVAYWRQQKWIQGTLEQGGRWHGTAVVIGHVGKNVIISHRRQILRCAPEQLRPVTTEERALAETPETELLGIKDMIESGQLKSKQFVDLVPEKYPTMSSEEASIEKPQIVEPRVSESQFTPPATEKTPESADPERPNEGATEDTEMNTEAPPKAAESSYGPIRRRVEGKSGSMTMLRPPSMKQDDFVEMMREVVPKLVDNFVDLPTNPSSASSSSASGIKRLRSPSPAERSDEPSPNRLKSDETDESLSVEECLALAEVAEDPEVSIETLIAAYVQKKMTKEVPAQGNDPLTQELVDDSKVVEWGTLEEKQTLRVHTGARARQIRKQHADRFIGSRFVIVRKPIEEGGHVDPLDPSTFSRWVLQGHLDPDLQKKALAGLLQSPTLSQIGRNLLMQLIASYGWDLQLGDIKGAFLEAGPLPKEYSPLFSELPPGGVPGIPSDAVAEILGNLYGQNDAPVAGFKTFDYEAQKTGWSPSKFDLTVACTTFVMHQETCVVPWESMLMTLQLAVRESTLKSLCKPSRNDSHIGSGESMKVSFVVLIIVKTFKVKRSPCPRRPLQSQFGQQPLPKECQTISS